MLNKAAVAPLLLLSLLSVRAFAGAEAGRVDQEQPPAERPATPNPPAQEPRTKPDYELVSQDPKFRQILKTMTDAKYRMTTFVHDKEDLGCPCREYLIYFAQPKNRVREVTVQMEKTGQEYKIKGYQVPAADMTAKEMPKIPRDIIFSNYNRNRIMFSND
jgi:hypothetical protein